PARARLGSDGTVSSAYRGFGGFDGGQHGNGQWTGFRARRDGRGAHSRGEEGLSASLRVANGHVGYASAIRVQSELQTSAGDSGETAGARIGRRTRQLPRIHDPLTARALPRRQEPVGRSRL